MLSYISVNKKMKINRGVAQLVARVVWDHEVAGSIPVTSTILRKPVITDIYVLQVFLFFKIMQ